MRPSLLITITCKNDRLTIIYNFTTKLNCKFILSDTYYFMKTLLMIFYKNNVIYTFIISFWIKLVSRYFIYLEIKIIEIKRDK